MERKHAREIKTASPNLSVFSAERWGLPLEAVKDMGHDLHQIWQRYHDCWITRKHDTSEYALIYLKGLMLLPNNRNYANIARSVDDPDSDGQNLQQYMSDSPWPAPKVFTRLQADIRADQRLQGGMLSLDESGDVRSGDQSAGAGHQYIGNVGKIAMGQVGVALGYYAANVWTMVDAELFLPANWFDEAHRQLRHRLHIPDDREFKIKSAIGLELIDRAQQQHLPFSRFSCDGFYGQDHNFRAELAKRKIPYLADIRSNIQVYLHEPVVGIPPRREGAKGPSPSCW
jgi:SRSO17 transposase